MKKCTSFIVVLFCIVMLMALFSYDVLSSYINIGTYEINDNILTATTSDEKYHYVFEIVDENTLSFLEEQSSKITVFDTAFSVVPQNGAVFQKE